MTRPSAIERVEVGDRAAYANDRDLALSAAGVEKDSWLRIDRRTCPECGRVFDLTEYGDAAEWAYGHDCEVES